MEEGYVTYQNREVPEEGFRVFIYAKDGNKKLVNSWDEFKNHVFSGEWYVTQEEAIYFNEQQFNDNEITESKELEKKEIDHHKVSSISEFSGKKRGRKRKQAST